ncbi:MAG: DUF2240 family protein [Candidatus Aenigmatarchaeota archaeon]
MGKVEDIIRVIKEKFKVSEEKVKEEIKQKLYEFSGLISEEGAAILVAREYGIDIKELKFFTPLNELIGGMKNVNVRVKVIKNFPLKEFDRRDGTKGVIKILLVSDGTDFARLVFWDEFAKEAEEMKIKIGDVLKVYNIKTRENIFGEIDIVIDKNSNIEFDSQDNLPSLDELNEKFVKNKYKRLDGNLDSIGFFEVIGIITYLFGNNFFFKVCPICNSKVGKKDEKYFCDIHGEIEPKNALFLRFELNNFSGNLRVVSFKETAEKLIEIDKRDLEKIENLKEFLSKMLIGKMIKVRGRARKNKILNIIELIANEIDVVDLKDETMLLIKNFES